MNDASLISLITIVIGFLASCIPYLLKICFKSKCEFVKCWCLEIKRNIQEENKASEFDALWVKNRPELNRQSTILQV
jgi:hypothetical protein